MKASTFNQAVCSMVFAFLVVFVSHASAQEKSADAIAEAAGAYLTALYNVKAVKETRCGYAVLMDIEEHSKKVEQDIRLHLPNKYKNEFPSFSAKLRNDSRSWAANSIKSLDGKIDSKTQCGLVVGGYLAILGHYWTEWEKIKK